MQKTTQKPPVIERLKRAIKKTMVRITSLDNIPYGEVLEHFPASQINTKSSLEMPFVAMAAHLKNSDYTLPAGTSRILKNLYYAPNNMLLTRSRRIIAEGSSTEREPNVFQWHDLFRLEKEHISGRCSSIRSLRNNYYHSLVDDLPRLFLLQHAAYADQEIKLLFPGGPTPIESFFLEKLAAPNVTVVHTEPDRLYSCDEFVFCDFLSRRFAGCLPPSYLDFFHQKLLPDRPRKKHKKILISRKKAVNARGVINEQELAAALLPLGYQSYVLEDLDLPEQITLFYDAESVVAPHGAGLTNLLYAQQANVLELHPCKALFPHYYYMCQSLNHNYQYWCGEAQTRHSPFGVDVAAVLRLLS